MIYKKILLQIQLNRKKEEEEEDKWWRYINMIWKKII